MTIKTRKRYSNRLRWFAKMLSRAQKSEAKRWRKEFGVVLRADTTDAEQLVDIVANDPYGYALKHDPKIIIDLGANVGFADIAFALRYPDAKVLAYEPEPGNFAALTANCASFPNIVPINKAITMFRDKKVSCRSCGGEWGYVFTTDGANTDEDISDASSEMMTVDSVTLHDIIYEYDIRPGDHALFKVNIAGFEHEIFSGDTTWIDSFASVMVRTPWPMNRRNQLALLGAFQNSKNEYVVQAYKTSLVFQTKE